jgi:hypothetical protein
MDTPLNTDIQDKKHFIQDTNNKSQKKNHNT